MLNRGRRPMLPLRLSSQSPAWCAFRFFPSFHSPAREPGRLHTLGGLHAG